MTSVILLLKIIFLSDLSNFTASKVTEGNSNFSDKLLISVKIALVMVGNFIKLIFLALLLTNHSHVSLIDLLLSVNTAGGTHDAKDESLQVIGTPLTLRDKFSTEKLLAVAEVAELLDADFVPREVIALIKSSPNVSGLKSFAGTQTKLFFSEISSFLSRHNLMG